MFTSSSGSTPPHPPLRCTTQSAYAAAKCSVRCGLVAVTCRREDISEHDVSRTAAEEVIGWWWWWCASVWHHCSSSWASSVHQHGRFLWVGLLQFNDEVSILAIIIIIIIITVVAVNLLHIEFQNRNKIKSLDENYFFPASYRCIGDDTISPRSPPVLPRSEWLHKFHRRQTDRRTKRQTEGHRRCINARHCERWLIIKGTKRYVSPTSGWICTKFSLGGSFGWRNQFCRILLESVEGFCMCVGGQWNCQ